MGWPIERAVDIVDVVGLLWLLLHGSGVHSLSEATVGCSTIGADDIARVVAKPGHGAAAVWAEPVLLLPLELPLQVPLRLLERLDESLAVDL